MIHSVKHFFTRFVQSDVTDTSGVSHGVEVATAALLVEMAQADYRQLPAEEREVRAILQQHLHLTPVEAQQLLDLAADELDHAACMHEFTRLINQFFSAGQKVQVVEMLWRVAYADGKLDKYEEHFVRKIADLLYVSHTDFIRAKHRVSAGIAGT